MWTAMYRIAALLFALILAAPAAQGAEPGWEQIVAQARGQSVFWNAWGGDERINGYIAWVGRRVAEDHGVILRHVKLADTADAVARVLAEKAAGREDGGSVDLIWINGENFAAMKQNGLLFGPFTQHLPNFELVDFADKPTTLIDFTVPTDGLEAPWGMAKIVFIYDSARVRDTPGSIPRLLDWAAAHPGRFTYPGPPAFTEKPRCSRRCSRRTWRVGPESRRRQIRVALRRHVAGPVESPSQAWRSRGSPDRRCRARR